MNHTERANLLYRILADCITCKINDKTYKVYPATPDILHRANELYLKILYIESFNEEWLTTQTTKFLPADVKDIDILIQNLEKREEDLKCEMYENRHKKDSLKKLRDNLVLVRKKLGEYYSNKHMFDFMTAEGYAAGIKEQFILSETLYDENDNKLEIDDYLLLEHIMELVREQYATLTQIRELSRTDPWRSIYNINKEDVFGKAAIFVSEEQKSLLAYSRMYDNIYEGGEAPSEEIMEDDDMLDGWLIFRKRERDKEKENRTKEEQKDALLDNRHQTAQELYIPVSRLIKDKELTQEQAVVEIENLNTPKDRRIKQQRDALIQQKGVVMDKDFTDVQLDAMTKKG